MQRKEIQEIIIEHLADVLQIDEVEITAQSSMAELGASSLDVVEVISLTMRQIKVKVPRSKLSDIENMNQLTDLLFE
ncbi:MAG TPA: phosphopantetheine-binding protein, partial [Hyphomicrobiaceae bacterium]|nr:phosphopantetheine-binding protein [Hyphomicrobiaceae bacterium]